MTHLFRYTEKYHQAPAVTMLQQARLHTGTKGQSKGDKYLLKANYASSTVCYILSLLILTTTLKGKVWLSQFTAGIAEMQRVKLLTKLVSDSEGVPDATGAAKVQLCLPPHTAYCLAQAEV